GSGRSGGAGRAVAPGTPRGRAAGRHRAHGAHASGFGTHRAVGCRGLGARRPGAPRGAGRAGASHSAAPAASSTPVVPEAPVTSTARLQAFLRATAARGHEVVAI